MHMISKSRILTRYLRHKMLRITFMKGTIYLNKTWPGSG
jgi:hypothetical protein